LIRCTKDATGFVGDESVVVVVVVVGSGGHEERRKLVRVVMIVGRGEVWFLCTSQIV